MASPATVSARQRHNQLVRHHGADAPITLAAGRQLEAAKLEAAIERAVAKFGPFTDEQRAKLAVLLQPSDDGGRDAAA